MSSVFSTLISNVRDKEISFLLTMGLTQEDAEDIFQEASVVLYDVMSSQRLTMKSTHEAYLHGICQNMAHKRLDEIKRKASYVDEEKLDRLLFLTDDEMSSDEIAGDDNEGIDYLAILIELLEKLSARDYSIIHGFYIEGKSLTALANENNMASVEVARTTKSRILSKLKEQATQLINKYY